MRFILALTSVALLSLGPVTGTAMPMDRKAGTAQGPVITFVAGWWEQENRSDAADRYWHLNRTDRRRYDQIEARIAHRHKRYHLDHYDRRDDRDLTEQRRLLDY